MKAKILKVELKKSRHGGQFYHAFFKGEDGKSFRSCLYLDCRNFARWQPVIREVQQGREIWLKDLALTKGGLIDADSRFSRVSAVDDVLSEMERV